MPRKNLSLLVPVSLHFNTFYNPIFQSVGNSIKEYKKCISVYSIRNQVRFKGNLGKIIKLLLYHVISIGPNIFDCIFNSSEIYCEKRTKLL